MSDSSTRIVILSERSLPAVAGDAKDLYLPRLAPFSPNRASRGEASFTCSLLAMSDPPTTVVILSERSLPAVAGDAKDLYLPRLAPFSPKPTVAGLGGPISCSPLDISDTSTSIVILSERSESKDLYLPRLAPFSRKRDSHSGFSFPYLPCVMSKEASS